MTANTAANTATKSTSSKSASSKSAQGAKSAQATAEDAKLALRQEPIPQPSEPMQFRAIGLVRARYQPEEDDKITKGSLTTPDGAVIEAVLLGRIMSLVKKHINLEDEHLWVVYPRTREKEADLHVQVVGVWEPETLQKEILKDDEPEKDEAGLLRPTRPKPPIKSADDLEDGYFSIRGEVVFHSMERQHVVVKIKQAPKGNDNKGRSFKLNLKGRLGPKAIHHFWDLKVVREGDQLVVKEGICIGAIPQRRGGPPRKGGSSSGGRRPGGSSGGYRRSAPGGPPRRVGSGSPIPRREEEGSSGRPKTKPVLKKKEQSETEGGGESAAPSVPSTLPATPSNPPIES